MLHSVKMKQDLSEPRQNLLRIMQEVGFGRIENLEIKDGLPVFDPPPEVISKIKLDSRSSERMEIDLTDFALKSEVRELFGQLDDIQNGKVLCIEIKRGLPFVMTVKRPVTLQA